MIGHAKNLPRAKLIRDLIDAGRTNHEITRACKIEGYPINHHIISQLRSYGKQKARIAEMRAQWNLKLEGKVG